MSSDETGHWPFLVVFRSILTNLNAFASLQENLRIFAKIAVIRESFGCYSPSVVARVGRL
jgi:hypothetical protein